MLILITVIIQCLSVRFVINSNGIYFIMLITVFGVNVFMAVMNAATSTLFKQEISLKYINRVTAIINMLATILLPLGQIIYGILADKFSIIMSFILALIGITGIFILSNNLRVENENVI